MMENLNISKILKQMIKTEKLENVLLEKQTNKPKSVISPKKIAPFIKEKLLLYKNSIASRKNTESKLEKNIELVSPFQGDMNNSNQKFLNEMNLNEINELQQKNEKKNQTIEMENRNDFCLENMDMEIERNVDIAEEDLEDISAAQFSRKEKIINEFSTDMVHLHLHELNKH